MAIFAPQLRISLVAAAAILFASAPPAAAQRAPIGAELSSYQRIEPGEEANLSVFELVRRGRLVFDAVFTVQEGGGRPLTTGVGNPLADPSRRLEFPFNFNRVSAMDANGCAGCHNLPFSGGGGDFVTGVFVAAQRFDAATFDPVDNLPLSGAVNERGEAVRLATIGNYRATLGMFGSGYIEMLARQMTADLQAIRDALSPGGAAELVTKGVSFGMLVRSADGSFDVSRVEGLPEQALAGETPSFVLRPFHQSGSVVSLREFSNNAFNHHHGMQSTERFGTGDPDGDGFTAELTVGDITAASLYQATLPVPGQIVPDDLRIEEAIFYGRHLFDQIGCASCHVERLPLDEEGWVFTEPNPYNPPRNLQPGEAPTTAVDLTSDELPGPRLQPTGGVVWVPAFTDLKLHDITRGEDDPAREALNINHPGGSDGFLGGNSRFLTKKLWGAANEPPFFHHGKFTTLREATLAHYGEAAWTRDNFLALSERDRNRVIEFLKSLQVLPQGTTATVVNERGEPKLGWPPRDFNSWSVTATTR